jgi:hypothetical protein
LVEKRRLWFDSEGFTASTEGRIVGLEELFTDNVASNRYNAKRRHWRKTRIGI